MSKYTTELRYICQSFVDENEESGANNINEIVLKSAKEVLGDFPIFDENYRQTLSAKIIKHYYTREIAYETVGLWRFKINTKLNEIMPYYNQLYESELLKFNPLYNIELNRSRSTAYNGNTKSHDESSTNSENISNSTLKNKLKTTENGNETNVANSVINENKIQKYSDTPQGSVDFNLTDNGIEKTEYLTNLTKNENEAGNKTSTNGVSNNELISNNEEHSNNNSSNNTDFKNTSNTSINNIEDYTELVKGKTDTVSYSSLLKEFRSTFLNIDMMIIEELSELFFGLY